jgi:cytochrome c peroxidase
MRKLRRSVFLGLTLGLVLGATVAWAQTSHSALTRQQAYARAAALGELGNKLFNDPSLSASGKMACATCHDPARAFGPPNALPVQFGGPDMRQAGLRAVPSLRYLQAIPQFTAHYYDSDDEGDSSVDNGPTGGLTWDGRVDRFRDQARIPLLSPFEMANGTPADVVARVRAAPYAGDLRALFGEAIFADPDKALAAVGEAIEVFQQDARLFYPYSSRYDDYLAGRATLSPQEARGLGLFEDPAKGNCINCHRSRRANNGTPPQFTDYGLIALAVPRNPAIPANADPAYRDLGACGPLRIDLAGHNKYCGLFRTPSLRNVATRQTFFHNGLVHDLREAVAFYVERDLQPEKWYPHGRFEDLPEPYWANLNREPPFDRKPGDPRALTDAEIDDITAFLKTLTDADQVNRPASAP